jgi:hypothetical protein
VEKVLGGLHVCIQEKQRQVHEKGLLTPKSQGGCSRNCAYIAEDNPEAADAFRVALERIREMLADLPEIGSIRSFNNKELFRFYLTCYFFCFSNSF